MGRLTGIFITLGGESRKRVGYTVALPATRDIAARRRKFGLEIRILP